MTTLQTTWTEDELLQGHPVSEPLFVRGVRCHGGFDASGEYRSPRTLNRVPAIAAWQESRAQAFGTPLLDIELSSWPGAYPNVAQARFLIEGGVPEPIISALTRIGTVEGFGAYLRHTPVPELRAAFVEDISGTAMAHLTRGLIEAHARDEAGFGGEGGHKQMWFAARDAAFEDPLTEDQTEALLQRMGIGGGYGAAATDPAAARQRQLEARQLDDIGLELEMLIVRMARLLLIEISAFHTFAWAEELLADDQLVAGEGEAARLVSFIRTDEAPHVDYLKTVLSEMRDRTFIGESGRRHPGVEVVGRLWEACRADSLGPVRTGQMNTVLSEVEHTLERYPRGGDMLEQFHQLGAMRPGPDGEWTRAA